MTLHLVNVSGEARVAAGASELEVLIPVNDDGYGVFVLDPPRQQIEEHSGAAVLTVVPQVAALGAVNVSLATRELAGSAQAGADFVPLQPYWVWFAPGQHMANVTVQLVDDALPEVDESFEVQLLALSPGGRLGTPATATVTIAANDHPNGFIGVAPQSTAVRVSGEQQLVTLQLVRGPGLFGNATVHFAMQGDAAALASELTPLEGTVHFAAGQASATLELLVLADNTPEIDKTFVLLLDQAGGALLNTSALRATITVAANDDANGVLSIVDVSVISRETMGHVTVALRRDAGTFGALRVPWQAVDGTARYVGAEVDTDAQFAVFPVHAPAPPPDLSYEHLMGPYFVGRPVNNATTWALLRWDDSQLAVVAMLPQLPTADVRVAGFLLASGALYVAAMAPDTTALWWFDPARLELQLVRAETVMARSVHVVSVEATKYLVVWGPRDSTTRADAESVLYWLDPAQHTATKFQNLVTGRVVHALGFRDGFTAYLATASPTGASRVFALVGQSMIFIDQVSAPSAQQWAHAVLDGHPYLVLSLQSQGPLLFRLRSSTLLPPAALLPAGLVAGDMVTVVTVEADQAAFLYVLVTSEAANRTAVLQWRSLTGNQARPVTGHTGQFVVQRELPVGAPVWRAVAAHALVAGLGAAVDTVYAMHAVNPATDYYPAQGSVAFLPGQALQTLTVGIWRDDQPEIDEPFVLQLGADIQGGARLAADLPINTSVIITANDDPWGVVAFAVSSRAVLVQEPASGNATVTLMLERQAGAFGFALVSWHVEGDAARDVSPTEGTLTLAEGQTQATLQLHVLADAEPELAEMVRVVLDDILGGARLDPNGRSAVLTIGANDDAYGVFAMASPGPVVVAESGGLAGVTIVRQGGAFGAVRVYFATEDGTAEAEADFAVEQSANFVDFAPMQTVGTATVALRDDGEPEEREDFAVVLVRAQVINASAPASGGPRVAAALRTQVAIEANDQASGVLRMARAGMSVAEEAGTIQVEVQRQAGTFGLPVTVAYTVQAPAGVLTADTPRNGTVTFAPGQQLAHVNLTLADDDVPEVSQAITVALALAAQGGVAADPPVVDALRSSTVVTVQASDDAFGRFNLVDADQVVTAAEGSAARLRVQRAGGLFQRTLLQWRVRINGSTDGFDPQRDLTLTAGVVAFEHLQNGTMAFDVPIALDGTPELDETFVVELTVVAGPGRVAGAVTQRVTIPANDDPHGQFGFTVAAANTAAVESDAGPARVALEVQRQRGLFGAVTLEWHVRLCRARGDDGGELVTDEPEDALVVVEPSPELTCATAGDFAGGERPSGVVAFAPGQASATIEVLVAGDVAVEGDELFYVDLAIAPDSPETGVLDNTLSRARVIILASDDGNGLFAFASQSLVQAVDEPGAVSVTVVRTIGTFGRVLVNWALEVQTGNNASFSAAPSGAMLPAVFGQLVFEPGNASQTIDLAVPDDATPELAATYRVVITAVSGQGRFAGQPARIVVRGSDDPHGVVVPQSLQLSAQPSVALTVGRAAGSGTFGQVLVRFALDFEPVVANQSMVQAEQRLCDPWCELTLADGSAQATADLALPMSVFLGLGDVVTATLLQVQLAEAPVAAPAPRLGAATSVNSTVDLTLARNVLDVGPARLEVAEGQVVPVRIDRRSVRGTLSVDWRVAGALAAQVSPSSGTAVVPAGQQSTEVLVTVVQDTQPEATQVVVVEVTGISLLDLADEPLNVLSREARLVIVENDDPRGVFSFAPSALQAAARGPFVEEQPEGLELTVERARGTLGRVAVDVRLGGNMQRPQDYTVVTPLPLVFQAGETAKNITVVLLDDDEPELPETLVVELVNATSLEADTRVVPRLGSAQALTLAMAASDAPYGLFGFADASVTVDEDVGQVTLRVVRAGGAIGTVVLDWALSSAEHQADVSPVSGTLTFAAGVTEQSLTLTVVDDASPEPDETLVLTLRNPSNNGQLSAASSSMALTVRANDVPNGRVEFARALLQVEEGAGTVAVPVTRTGGAFGAVTVGWRVQAAPGSSFSLNDLVGSTSGSATLAAGQRQVDIVLGLRRDGVPELDEPFVVELQNVGAGAELGAQATATVVIVANEDPNGVLAFVCEDQLGGANAPGDQATSVPLRVERRGGALGTVTVQVQARPALGSARAGTEYTVLSETLVFAEGETLQQAVLNTNRLVSGDSRTIVVELAEVTGGARIATAEARATVTMYRTVGTLRLLRDLQEAQCDSERFDVTAPSAAGSQALQYGQAEVDLMLYTIQQLLETVAQDPEGQGPMLLPIVAYHLRDLLVPQHFAVALSALEFGQAGALLEQYATLVALSQGEDWCPGQAAVPLTADVTVEYQRRARASELNGAAPFVPSAQHSVQLPDNLLQETNNCTGVLGLVSHGRNVWFPLRTHYYTSLGPQPADGLVVMNDRVLAITLPAGSRVSNSDPLVYALPQPASASDTQDPEARAVCVWWDFTLESGRGAWSTRGCRRGPPRTVGDVAGVSCECDHATHFAVLVGRVERERLSVLVRAAAIVVASVALVIVAVHLSRSTLRTDNMLYWLPALFAVTCTLVLLAVTGFVAHDLDAGDCEGLAVATHYFFVAACTWAVLTLGHVHQTLVKSSGPEPARFRTWHFLAGWLVPAAVVVVYFAISHGVYDGDFSQTYGFVTERRELCFLPSTNVGGLLCAVLLPMLLPLVMLVVVLGSLGPRQAEWSTFDDLYFGRPNGQALAALRNVLVLLTLFWAFIGVDVYAVADSEWAAGVALALGVVVALALLHYFVFNATVRASCRDSGVAPIASSTTPMVTKTGAAAGARSPTGSELNASLDYPGSIHYYNGQRPPARPRAMFPELDESPRAAAAAAPAEQYDLMLFAPPSRFMQPASDADDFDDLIYALRSGQPEAAAAQPPSPGVRKGSGGAGYLDLSESTDTLNVLDGDGDGRTANNYEMRRIAIADTHL